MADEGSYHRGPYETVCFVGRGEINGVINRIREQRVLLENGVYFDECSGRNLYALLGNA